MNSYRVARIGFDTIIMAFRARLPVDLAEQLTQARMQARETRSPIPFALGRGEIPGEVLSHGVQGGYDTVFSTGELGEMWQFKTDQKGDKWPLRMKIRAGALLAHGYPDAANFAMERLIGFKIPIEDARLSEVHVCIDILTDAEFRLDESCLIRPGRSVVRPYEALDQDHPLLDEDVPSEVQRILRGNRLETLCIGSRKTGSQTIIYDKRSEATIRRNRMFFEAYGLDCNDRKWRLWRNECRFSGPVLKRNFRVRTFEDLGTRARDMVEWATDRVRYAAPGQEHMHPSRRTIAPYWRAVRSAIPLLSAPLPSLIPPARAQEILDREKKEALEAAAVGAITTHAAMSGANAETILKELPDRAASLVRHRLRRSSDRVLENFERAAKLHTKR